MEVRLMLRPIKRKVVVGIGVLAIGVLAVACAGSPGLGARTPRLHASIGGFTVELPSVTLPFMSPASQPATSQTTTTTQSSVQDVTHSGEGCPIALPQ
jgi:hypothetical protein